MDRLFARPPVVAVLLLIVAVTMRLPLLGDPIAGVDEQFYLLVGDRIWSGAWPYVDIWDRKPPGLFLLYAAIRALPGDGILAYQLVATLALALTGLVVTRIARRGANDAAALAAGLATIVFSTLLGVGLGEAPVFYDLLTALAAWLILRMPVPHALPAAVAMLLCGLAISIKTTAVFEGAAFGLILAARQYRASGLGARLIRRVTLWMALGLLPMAAAATLYAATGRFGAFRFAMVDSVLRRSGGLTADTGVQLIATLLLLLPLAIPAVIGLRRHDMARANQADDRALLAAWVAATAIGFVAIGYFAFHYAMPLIPPLAILAARALRQRVATAGAALLALAAAAGLLLPSPRTGDRRALAALAAALPPQVRDQCLLVLEGPAILYHVSHACLASPFAFPGHFAAADEAEALPQPRPAILAAALARRPAAVVDLALGRDLAGAGYVATAARPIRLYGGRRVVLTVWWRRDLVRKMSSLAGYPGR
ncbi:hypothetical protein ACU5AX_11780 [Sphingomonas sp. XXL09]|uniref:hypothetical protein n=1 Tax=Sphingomonas sp. XXL09 TaxID=3457787 RepID=UPI00406BD25F